MDNIMLNLNKKIKFLTTVYLENFLKDKIEFTAFDITKQIRDNVEFVEHKYVKDYVHTLMFDYIQRNEYTRTIVSSDDGWTAYKYIPTTQNSSVYLANNNNIDYNEIINIIAEDVFYYYSNNKQSAYARQFAQYEFIWLKCNVIIDYLKQLFINKNILVQSNNGDINYSNEFIYFRDNNMIEFYNSIIDMYSYDKLLLTFISYILNLESNTAFSYEKTEEIITFYVDSYMESLMTSSSITESNKLNSNNTHPYVNTQTMLTEDVYKYYVQTFNRVSIPSSIFNNEDFINVIKYKDSLIIANDIAMNTTAIDKDGIVKKIRVKKDFNKFRFSLSRPYTSNYSVSGIKINKSDIIITNDGAIYTKFEIF